jgi:hypothetical protein
LSGVDSTVYQLDGGAVTAYSGPFNVATGGNHTITFHSTDVASNVEGTESANFSVLGSSATAVTSSLNPSTYGQSVTFTASVTPATATGTVTFLDGAATLGTVTLAAGKALFTTAALTAGAHSITGVYSGDANVGGSTSPARPQSVKKAPSSTSLVSSLNPSAKGQAVTFTATVAANAGLTGKVTFKDGTKSLGAALLDPNTHQAAITKSTLAVGTHSIKATFAGNANVKPSTSAIVNQVVN